MKYTVKAIDFAPVVVEITLETKSELEQFKIFWGATPLLDSNAIGLYTRLCKLLRGED